MTGEGKQVMAHNFQMYKDKEGLFRVRFRYNHEIIASTQGYKEKSSAENAIHSMKTNGPGAEVIDDTHREDAHEG
jgi:uncharacterized protein YegP (UPF0339 family)